MAKIDSQIRFKIIYRRPHQMQKTLLANGSLNIKIHDSFQ